ncbi:hypothetical protein ACFOGJ_17430 [Marinibaculum pumilum]|uniref:WAP domain-containing protein n=1 Tax=Marinibaculum pumilum TaxID=1766165 RepID=A0ABV7L2Z7_9PROT
MIDRHISLLAAVVFGILTGLSAVQADTGAEEAAASIAFESPKGVQHLSGGAADLPISPVPESLVPICYAGGVSCEKDSDCCSKDCAVPPGICG